MTHPAHPKLSASLEDYLEAIYNLSQADAVARSKDIAEALAVSRASVTGALRALAEKGLVNYKPYGYITLTKAGTQAAAKVVGRHAVLHRFFAEVLGADADLARAAACRAEHTLGPEITARLTAFVDFIAQPGRRDHPIVEMFDQYWTTLTEHRKDEGQHP